MNPPMGLDGPDPRLYHPQAYSHPEASLVSEQTLVTPYSGAETPAAKPRVPIHLIHSITFTHDRKYVFLFVRFFFFC